MNRICVLLALAFVPGCTVVDLPEDIEDLVVYGFEHFEDDPAHLQETGDQLFPWVERHYDELSEGWRVSDLTDETVESAGVENPDLEGVVGAIASVDYRHRLGAILPVILAPNKDELFDNHVAFEVLDDTDRACFLDRDCETYRWTVEKTVQVPLLGQATQTVTEDFRWIEGLDGSWFVVVRQVAPDPIEFNTSIVAVDQQYGLAFLFPHEGAARRAEAYWVESRVIGADVPDSFAVSQAANEMANQADRIDDYIDDGEGAE